MLYDRLCSTSEQLVRHAYKWRRAELITFGELVAFAKYVEENRQR
jgi:hypothetical protein